MTTTETPGTLRRIFDYSARADPYPLYAELRETPVALQEDGSYVISTYREITDILHDPHLSSDVRNLSRPMPALEEGVTTAFIKKDPPEHDRLRRMAMRHFGPPHSPGLVAGMESDLTATVGSLIDDFAGKERIDVVDDFACPFPVTVTCHLLGVPREEEPRFHVWVNDIMNSVDYDPETDPREKLDKGVQARKDLRRNLAGLVEQRHGRPGDDLLARLANDDGPDGRMTDEAIVATAKLLLIAGHETIVNLIANGMLTLLRHPQVLERLRHEPDLVAPLVEELLRYEYEEVSAPRAAHLVEALEHEEEVSARYAQLLKGASAEVLHLAKPPYVTGQHTSARDVGVADGVRMRSVYETDGFTDAVSLETALRGTAEGGQLRLASRLPVKLVVFDRAAALLPVRGDRPAAGSLVVHSPALVEALVALFESVWERAEPVSLATRREGPPPPVPAPRPEDPVPGSDARAVRPDRRTREILHLMATGMKDDTIARVLKVSRRTVQKHVSEAGALLGARTRFQIALLAAERGWLAERP
ncbi:cytochrome P450 [Streptomyces olivaceoviridis]